MKIINNVLLEIDDKDINNGELILDNIEEIAESVFENNSEIKKIQASNLIKVNARAFYKCENLLEIIAPKLSHIEDEAFYGTKLSTFDFSHVLEIGKKAFEASKLENILLPKTLKKIGKSAFANNPYLVRVEFLPSMTKIKDGMFENCINLKDFKFSNTINKLGIGVFKNCRKMVQIDLPEHLKVIESYAFWKCKNLRHIGFNDEIEVINDYAFGHTKINDVVLPTKLKEIGKLPFYMCNQLETLSISKIWHNEILDKSNAKLKELTINQEKIKVLKHLKKLVNYNGLPIIRYSDESFQLLAKPIRYYDQEYFLSRFPKCDLKKLMTNDEIFNICYWESILGNNKLLEINPIAIIALPPNINMIKAFYNKSRFYENIINKHNVVEFNNKLALIKFITIFGGLCKQEKYNIDSLIERIGMTNLTKQFLHTNVKELNQKFIEFYLKLSETYDYREINNIMPFLYNSIDKVINLENMYARDTIKNMMLKSEEEESEIEIDVKKYDIKSPNYEWLDNVKTSNLLWGYVLASTSDYSIDSKEEARKALTYYIKDDEGMVVASSRAYYSEEEKYLLFNSLTLSQSFINKGYSVEKIKSLIIEYVLAAIEDTINFLNEKNRVVDKVHVGLSEKSIKEQLINRGTKIIGQNI